MAEELVANFSIDNVELNADIELSEGVQFDALFKVNAAPFKVSQLENDMNYQTGEQVQEAIEHASIIIEGSSLIGVAKQDQTVTITSQTYVFEQGIVSDTWVINHDLNKFPTVTVIDTAGTLFDAQVEYTDRNNCIVYINGATKGTAYLN